MFPANGGGGLPHMQGYASIPVPPYMNQQYAAPAQNVPVPVLPVSRNLHSYQNTSQSNAVSRQLDNLIATTKWMQCASLVDSWVSQAQYVMENEKNELDPYIPFESTISESGTDLSHAQTAPFDESSTHDSRNDTTEIPSSPPWRSLSEGGEISIQPMGAESALASKLGSLSIVGQSVKDAAAESGGTERSSRAEGTKKSLIPSFHRSAAERTDEPKVHRNEHPEKRNTSQQGPLQENTDASKGGTNEKQVTLGIILGKTDEQAMAILRIKDGGVAALHGGLKVGMRIISIDGIALNGLSPIEISRLMIGPDGSVAVLEILEDDGSTASMEIARNMRTTRPSTQNFGILKKNG